MAKIKGKWKWNKVVYDTDATPVESKVVFTSNGEQFDEIIVFSETVYGSFDIQYKLLGMLIVAGRNEVQGDMFCEIEEKYRVMDFGETEQDIDDSLNEFILANATEYSIAEKLVEVANNVSRVFDAGKKEERSYFWNTFMHDKLENWRYLFYSPRWNDNNFYPTKDIKPEGPASYSFFSHGITNFKKRLKECGVKLDTSKVTGGNYMFASCSVLTHLPTISFTGLTESISNVFYCDKTLVEIEKIKLKEDGSTTFLGWFDLCHALETIAFEGVIGQNMDLHWSTKLSKDSITNIINHLSDDATGKTLTLSKAAVDRAFKGGLSAADPSTTTDIGSATVDWFDLITTKQNWTITLVIV